jgi:antitoxin MazE
MTKLPDVTLNRCFRPAIDLCYIETTTKEMLFMQSHIRKWGNSLAVRIPKTFADAVGLTDDSPVEITIKDGQILIRPVQTQVYRLHNLLAQVTPDNIHGEIDTGFAVGREII